VERLVKPERDKQDREIRKRKWWQFAERAPALRAAVAGFERVLAVTQTSPHLCASWLSPGVILDQSLTVIASSSDADFAVRQSRVQEVWTREFGATLGTTLRFTSADSGQPFPLPATDLPDLQDTATGYHTHRATLMVARNEGLTKTYNRFHNPSDRAADIQRLRELHHNLDLAVLRAYGWDDLAARAAPEFLTEDTEPDHRYQGRLFWPAPFRDEVLARLLDLNRARAEEERRLGITAGPSAADTDEELEDA